MAKVRLNLKGLEEIAKSRGMHDAVDDLAEKIADNVRSQGHRVGDKDGGAHEVELPVKVYADKTTTDMRVNRARAYVTLAHPAGLAVQAKHGALTKAASEAGLKVKGD